MTDRSSTVTVLNSRNVITDKICSRCNPDNGVIFPLLEEMYHGNLQKTVHIMLDVFPHNNWKSLMEENLRSKTGSTYNIIRLSSPRSYVTLPRTMKNHHGTTVRMVSFRCINTLPIFLITTLLVFVPHLVATDEMEGRGGGDHEMSLPHRSSWGEAPAPFYPMEVPYLSWA